MYGNRQTFPRSTAKPITARRNSTLLDHFSLIMDERRLMAIRLGLSSKVSASSASQKRKERVPEAADWGVLIGAMPSDSLSIEIAANGTTTADGLAAGIGT